MIFFSIGIKKLFNYIYMSILVDIFQNYIMEIFKVKDTKFYYLSLIKEDNGWSIHGLWPQYSKNKYPTFCKKVKFDIHSLSPILDELNEKWYSYKKTEKDDEEFWKHEWEKHGSCMFVEMNEFEYFSKTLELFDTAVQIDLPSEFYDEETKKCLIPLTQDFKFDLET